MASHDDHQGGKSLIVALYHFTTKALSRGTRSTVRAVAYRAGCEIRDLQTGEAFSYAQKDVAHVELLLPHNAPDSLAKIQSVIQQNRQTGVQALVNAVESAETRSNSRVWREFEFALHRELTKDQNIALAKEFVQDQLCSRGMTALLNFHFDKDPKTGEEKPHCHVLVTTRHVGEEGFTTKAREWNSREVILELREQWAAYSNFHLKLQGHEVQIDHRSYHERGIEMEPQPKQGKNVLEQEQRLQKLEHSPGPFTEKAQAFQDVQIRNLYRILRRPEVVFEIVSKHHATFMWADVQKVLHRYIDDEALFQKMETRLKSSKELALLKPEDDKEKAIYTTQTLLKAEKSLVETAGGLANTKSHSVETTHIKAAIKEANQRLQTKGIPEGLSEDQRQAIHHFTEAGQLKCGVGIAGAGKTTALGVCQEIWNKEGYAVYGLAPTGKAAQNLSQNDIPSMTLHKFLKSFEEGRCQYTPNSILVLDEAGMVDVERFSKLLGAVQKLGVKLIVVGDGAQLQPIEAGPAFRLITERIGKSELSTVVRQREDWQREATVLFGKQQTQEAIHVYQDRGHIHLIEEKIPSLSDALAAGDKEVLARLHGLASYVVPRMYREMKERSSQQDHLSYLKWKAIEKATAEHARSDSNPDIRKATKEALLKAWHTDFKAYPEKEFLMLAFTNRDVADLNTGARFLLKQSGQLSKKEISYKIAKETENDFGKKATEMTSKAFAKGDRIVFTRNQYGLNVRNGTLARIVDLNRNLITVKLEHEDRSVSFAPTLNPFFDHGWATTIHKSQGTTTDKTYVLASYDMSQNLTYVALTRHREDIQVFGSSLDFWRPEKVAEILSTSGEKLAARDYLDAVSLEKLMSQEDKLLGKLFIRLSDELDAMGAVSKQVFWKVADQFLGREHAPRDKRQEDFLFKSVREQTRAEKILNPKVQKGFWKEAPSKSLIPVKKLDGTYRNTHEETRREKVFPQKTQKRLWSEDAPEVSSKKQKEQLIHSLKNTKEAAKTGPGFPQKIQKGFWKESSSPSFSKEDKSLSKGFWKETGTKETYPQKLQKGFWKTSFPSFYKADGKSASLEKEKELELFERRAFEKMARHIEAKLHEIESYAGTRLAHQAREELHSFMQTLGENKEIFETLRSHNPQLMKEAQEVFKEKDHQLENIHAKGPALDF